VLAATVVALGIALYLGLRYTLFHSFDQQLRLQAEVVAASVGSDAGRLSLDPAAVGPPDGEHFVRLVDENDTVVLDTSPSHTVMPLDPGDISRALAGDDRYATIDGPDETLRIVTIPVTRDGDVVGALQFAMYRGDTEDSLRALVTLLAIGLPLSLLAALAGGYLLAGRALEPVATITTLAASIGGSGEDLHARLNLDLPDDELGRLARTFDAMLDRIEGTFERQRRFTADAAHELRTPLSVMRGEVDHALARSRTPEEYRASLHDLDADLERLTGLVGALLTLARADRGTLTLSRTHFDLAELIGTVAEQYEEPLAQAGISPRTDTSATPIDADQDLLVQVLVNLLDNALAHTPTGGTVSVGCRPDGARARLWVADTGVGIASEHLPNIFERFYRVESNRPRASGGVGLGLNICRSIVQAHGGTIELTSSVGHGTRVEIVLPARS